MPNLSELKTIGISILIATIILSLGAMILSEWKNAAEVTTSHSVANQSSGAITANGYGFNTTYTPVASGSISAYSWNSTTGVVFGNLVLGTNYSVLSYDLGRINITYLGNPSATTKVNVSYAYTTQEPTNASQIGIQGLESIKGLADWLTLIIIAFAGILVVTLLVKGLKDMGMGASGE